MLIELFSLGVTAEVLWVNIGTKSAISLQWGSVYPKFHVQGVAPTNHSSCHKARVNDLSCGIRIWAQLSFVLSQITCLTDGQKEFSSLDSVCIPCSTVKMHEPTVWMRKLKIIRTVLLYCTLISTLIWGAVLKDELGHVVHYLQSNMWYVFLFLLQMRLKQV